MPTVALKLYVADRYQEVLIAELSDLDFEGFEQSDDFLIAYIPAARWDDVKREHVESWLSALGERARIEEAVIEDQNWNRTWEETVAPIAVPPFLVKPTWRRVPNEYRDLILLEIDPKMSFGTGYHESTRLILRMLPAYAEEGAHVLDAGTGTGILAIAAAKLGAAADAFDVDPWSQRNALENIYLNGVQDRVRMFEGGIGEVPEAEYDLVIANINLNVIVGLLPAFGDRLRPAGRLLVSGVLVSDRERLVASARNASFALIDAREEGEWWAGAFESDWNNRIPPLS